MVFPTHHDQGPLLLGVSWSFTLGATILVALRYFCRIRYVAKLWWDDFWMTVALVFSWGMSITWSFYTALGGTSYNPSTHDRGVQIMKINWISQVWCIVALVTGKIAIASLISRLQAPCRWRSIVLWVVPSINAAWCLSEILMIFLQCQPTAKIFDQSIPGTCIDSRAIVYNATACGVYFALMDLLLAALPIQMIWNLQMPRRQKISLCCLLSTGVVCFAAAIVKTITLQADLHRDADFIRLSAMLFVWNAIEANLVIMAGCLPTITPLLPGFRKQWLQTHKASTADSEKYLAPRRTGLTSNWFDRPKMFSTGSRDDVNTDSYVQSGGIVDRHSKGPTSLQTNERPQDVLDNEPSPALDDSRIRVTTNWEVTSCPKDSSEYGR